MRKIVIPSWVKNKYFIAGVLFVFHVFFMVDTDVFTIIKRKQYLASLKVEKELREKRIEKLEEQKNALDNEESIERFAREQYRFKKSNEDVFVIVSQETEN